MVILRRRASPRLPQRYNPFVFAVDHTEKNTDRVLSAILKLKARTVGVEVSHWEAFQSKRMDEKSILFWRNLITGLNKHSVQVVFLVPDPAAKKIVGEQEKLRQRVPFNGPTISLMVPQINTGSGLFPALVRDTMPRIIQKNASKRKPEIIVTGFMHGKVIQSGLKVPERQFKSIFLPDLNEEGMAQLQAKMTRELKSVREFQISRMKQKESQIAKIKKRKAFGLDPASIELAITDLKKYPPHPDRIPPYTATGYGTALSVLTKLFGGIFQGKKVLEIGTNIFDFQRELHRRGAAPYAMDIRHGDQPFIGMVFQRGNIKNLKNRFKGEKFDAIVIRHVLESGTGYREV